jgi:hypothetical protein
MGIRDSAIDPALSMGRLPGQNDIRGPFVRAFPQLDILLTVRCARRY